MSFCPHCGVSITVPDARFCPSCGKALRPEVQPVLSAALAAPEGTPAPPRRGSQTARYVLIALIGLSLLGLILGALEGSRPSSQAMGGMFIWYPVLFGLLWRNLGKRGWIGALVGLAAAFGVSFAIGFIEASTNPIHALARDPNFAAIRRFDPQAFDKLAQAYVDATRSGRRPTQQELAVLAWTHMGALVDRAVPRASDAAVESMVVARLRVYEEVAAKDRELCFYMLVGDQDSVEKIVSALSSLVSPATLNEATAAVRRLLVDAAEGTGAKTPYDDARYSAALRPVDMRLESAYGISSRVFFDDSMQRTAGERCTAGLLLLSEALKLDGQEKAVLLRGLLGAS